MYRALLPLLALGTLLVAASPAPAANGPQYGSIGQYGEVWRGGGFDTCWYDGGKYDGQGAPQGPGQRCTQGEAQPTPGEFVDPVGFAVDTHDTSTADGTALYVLDRVSNLPSRAPVTTTWRLQKLDDHGSVLASDQFTLPDRDPHLGRDRSGVFNYEMQGLAVDPVSGVVYATVVAFCDNANYAGCNPPPVASSSTEYVEEILAWSTTPDTSGPQPVLGPPTCPVAKTPMTTCPDQLAQGRPGYPTPGVVSTATQLSQGGPPEGPPGGTGPYGSPQIVNPEGLAVDASGSDRYLAIEAADATSGAAGTGVTQVCVTGATCSACPSSLPAGGWLSCYDHHPGYGDMRLVWSANELTGLPNDNGEATFFPAGISTVPDGSPNAGSLTVLLDEQSGFGQRVASNIDVVDLPADLQSGSRIQSSGSVSSLPAGGPPDYAAVDTTDFDPEADSGDPDVADGGPVAATQLASPQVVALGNGLYAGDFEPDQAGQPDPQNPNGQPGLWNVRTPGVRLLAPLADGTLSNDPTSTSNPPLTTLFDTLGNTNPSGPCTLTDPVSSSVNGPPIPSLAAGANGAVWVLTRGLDSFGGIGFHGTTQQIFEGGRYLIELAPQQGTPCPTPSGTFTMAPPGGSAQTGPLTVKVGSNVTFDACPPSGSLQCPATGSPGIDYLGAAAAQYTWDFGDGASSTVTSTQNETGQYPWPTPTVEHQYNRAGSFPVTLTLMGDFGRYVQTGVVNVTPGSTPRASFTWNQPSSPSQTLNFDGSGSTPAPGDSIIDYHWEWGDGQVDDTATPTDTHSYSRPGSYTVKLWVLDSAYGHSPTAVQSVTVKPPPPPPPPATTTTTTTPVGPAQAPPGRPKVKAKFAPTASRRGLYAVVVACPAGQTACAGSVVLRSTSRHKSAVLGRGTFRLGGGQGGLVLIHLSRRARMILSHPPHRLRALATVQAANPQGNTSVLHEQLTIRPAPRHSRRRRTTTVG